MRTKNLFMTLAILTMAGCSQNEIIETGTDVNKGIGFGVYTGVQTKGAETTTTGLEATGVGFGVVALDANKTAVYMTERHVTKGVSAWEYTNTAYWPADGTSLNFYSYAPQNGAGITKTGFEATTPTIGFAIQDNWDDMVDLVAAKNENATTKTQVSVQFSHVLTRIAFTAKTSESLGTGTTVAVTGLSIVGNTNNSGSCFYESGDYSILNDTWSNPVTRDADYSILTSTNVAVTDNATDLLGTDKYLFCIPVTSLAADKIKVKITYAITSNSNTSSKEETVSIPADHFVKGTAYTYTFVINMNGISFTVNSTIPGWGSGSSDLGVNN